MLKLLSAKCSWMICAIYHSKSYNSRKIFNNPLYGATIAWDIVKFHHFVFKTSSLTLHVHFISSNRVYIHTYIHELAQQYTTILLVSTCSYFNHSPSAVADLENSKLHTLSKLFEY